MSKKYVITNCPAFMKPSYCKDKCSYSIANERDSELTYKFEFDEDSKCQDCTDCVMKQIVELCRKENIEGKSLASIMRLSNKDTKEFLSRFASNKILELLDIEEVE